MSKKLAEKIAEALKVIESIEYDKMELGKHVVNDDFYFLVQGYESKDPAVARHEAHRCYVDIQYVVEGKEAIDIAPMMFMEVDEPYDADRDVVFFKEPKQATRYVLFLQFFSFSLVFRLHVTLVCVNLLDRELHIRHL